MNDHDVIDRLRTALDDVHHDRPLSQVVRRGRVVRARRRAPGVVAACVALAGAITVAMSLTAPNSAFADWTSEPEPADPAVAAAIDASCRASSFDGALDDEPLILDVRGQHAVALYLNEAGELWDCNRFQGTGQPGDPSWWGTGGGSGPNAMPDATSDQPVQVVTSGTSWGADTGGMTWLAGRVVPGVERVEVRVPGSTVTAAVSGGYFEAWWPSISAQAGTALITAYDSQGVEVASTSADVYGFGL